jgi:hypothetical protein
MRVYYTYATQRGLHRMLDYLSTSWTQPSSLGVPHDGDALEPSSPATVSASQDGNKIETRDECVASADGHQEA